MLDENQLALTALLRSAVSGEKPILPEKLDWDAVLHEAEAQTVAALAAAAVPEEHAAPWRKIMMQNQARFIRVLHAQTQLVQLFDSAGIPLVILKGTAAAAYYPGPFLRTMGDVDFLVPQAQIEAAYALMQENGYLPVNPERTPADSEDEMPRHFQFQKGGVEFELHHHFSSQGLDIEAVLIDGLKRAVRREIGGREFPTLPDPENGLVLLAHARQHMLETGLGLRQVLDWAMCLRSLSAEDTGRLMALARETGLETLALTLNRVCRDYLGTETADTEESEAALEAENAFLALVFERGNFGRKQGTNRPFEAVTMSVREQGLFPYLQAMGMHNWKAAQKYAVLRPFAWMHTVCRYTGKGLKLLLRTPGRFRTEFASGSRLYKIRDSLGIDRRR